MDTRGSRCVKIARKKGRTGGLCRTARNATFTCVEPATNTTLKESARAATKRTGPKSRIRYSRNSPVRWWKDNFVAVSQGSDATWARVLDGLINNYLVLMNNRAGRLAECLWPHFPYSKTPQLPKGESRPVIVLCVSTTLNIDVLVLSLAGQQALQELQARARQISD